MKYLTVVVQFRVPVEDVFGQFQGLTVESGEHLDVIFGDTEYKTVEIPAEDWIMSTQTSIEDE